MKKILSFILIIMMLGSNILAYAEEPLKGSVTENDNYQKKEDDLFTGKIESLERKDIINMIEQLNRLNDDKINNSINNVKLDCGTKLNINENNYIITKIKKMKIIIYMKLS